MPEPSSIQVLLFGPQARLAGRDTLTITLDQDTPTAGEVLDAIALMHPELVGAASNRLAVNHQMAAPDQRVSHGDEVALIGMLGGG